MKPLLLLFCILVTKIALSQSLSPDIIASSGGFFSNGNNTLSWTIGEPIIQTVASTSNILTQGFQQSNYIITFVEEHSDKCHIDIYPNPTSDYFTINIESLSQANLILKIIDINGRILTSHKLETSKQIDISNFVNGIYYIQIYNNKNHPISSYKLQKIN